MFTTYFFVFLVITCLFFVYRQPPIAFGLAFCLYGIEQLAGSLSFYFVMHSSLINLAIGTFVIAGILSSIISGKKVISNYPLTAWFAIFLYLLAFISLTWTPDLNAAWRMWDKTYAYIITWIIILPLLVHSLRDLGKGLLYMFLIGSVIVLLLNIYGNYYGRSLVLLGGALGNPLAIAQISSYVIFAAVLLPIQKPIWLWTVLRWAVVGLAIILIVRSGSRGQFFFTLATILVMLPFARQLKKPSAYLAMGITVSVFTIIIAWVLNEYGPTSTRWTADGVTADTTMRFKMAIMLLETWLSNPIYWLFGLGNSASYEVVGTYPHIVPLEILGEEGLIGAACVLIFFIFVQRAFLKLLHLFSTDYEKRAYISTFGAIVFFEFLLCWKQGNLLGSSLMFGCGILLLRLERIQCRSRTSS